MTFTENYVLLKIDFFFFFFGVPYVLLYRKSTVYQISMPRLNEQIPIIIMIIMIMVVYRYIYEH